MSEQQITWDGRTLHGSDRFGQWKTLSSNWDDSPEVKGIEEEREGADGELDLPFEYAARLITLTGVLHTDDHDVMHDAMHFFNGAREGVFQVDGHGPSLWCVAKRNSGTKFDIRTDTYASWQVRLKAVDPCKYGTAATFNAAIGAPTAVSHQGNHPAVPQDVIIRGDSPGGYTVTLDGQNYVVTASLVPGRPHRIDYDTGVLRVDGIITQNSVGNTNLTTVPPGPTVGLGLYRNDGYSTGTATLEMTVYDTFI